MSKAATKTANTTQTFLGLRTAIYSAPDIDEARQWYSDLLGVEAYFNEPFYVGFNVGGYELGLIPDGDTNDQGGVTVYWGVDDADEALTKLLDCGANVKSAVQDVGGGIRVGTVVDPFGNIFGFIENPHFKLPE